MNLYRGILMLAAGVFVIWRGLVAHGRLSPWLFYGAGAAAIGLGIFHLVSKPPKPRV
jgi:hypothetical protein